VPHGPNIRVTEKGNYWSNYFQKSSRDFVLGTTLGCAALGKSTGGGVVGKPHRPVEFKPRKTASYPKAVRTRSFHHYHPDGSEIPATARDYVPISGD